MGEKLRCLGSGNLTGGPKPFYASGIDLPLFTSSKGLTQIGKIRKGGHRLNPHLLQLISSGGEVKLTLQMMKPGLKKRFTVEGTP